LSSNFRLPSFVSQPENVEAVSGVTLAPVEWPEAVERVAAVLRERGIDARLEEFAEGTPTAADAARAVGCPLDQIVKSLVFVCDGRPVLALVPGDKRADPNKVAAAAGAGYARSARREEVRSATGFDPGAVAPFPVSGVARVFMDRSLLHAPVVWVGAGSERHMAGLSPSDVARLSGAELVDLADG
jgi:prolyl-tRNA editing enzyme YbaK/EbsC (Cys-tRNA(Pro) deacylase)